MKYEAEVNGHDALMRAAVQTHMDYEKSLFSGQEKKK